MIPRERGHVNLPPRQPLSEAERVQNRALGAYLMWRMGNAFAARAASNPRIELHFVLLPLLWHRPTLSKVSSTLTPSGLAQFVAKLRDNEDELLAVHTRAVKLRDQSLESIAAGKAAGLLSVDFEAATVASLEVVKPPSLPARLIPMQKAAEKLGIWFAEFPVTQVVSMMRVSL